MASLNDSLNHGDFQAAKQYAAEQPIEFVLCRTGKHVVDDLYCRDIAYEPSGAWTQVHDCERCGCEVHKHFDARGMSAGTTYPVRPEGYLAEPGTGRALVSRSGRAAMNLARREMIEENMAKEQKQKEKRRRSKP